MTVTNRSHDSTNLFLWPPAETSRRIYYITVMEGNLKSWLPSTVSLITPHSLNRALRQFLKAPILAWKKRNNPDLFSWQQSNLMKWKKEMMTLRHCGDFSLSLSVLYERKLKKWYLCLIFWLLLDNSLYGPFLKDMIYKTL